MEDAGRTAFDPASSGAGHIVVRAVSKSYQEGDRLHTVLDGASVEIDSGEFVALLGPSGSGKSTLLNLIGGIDSPDDGRILVDGREVTSLEEPERTLFRRDRVGLVFQFFNLLPTLNVLENLLLPLELKGTVGSDAVRVAEELLERVGLEARAGAFPDRLSGGEQQRIAVARALVHGPAVVLADEPTGSLDADASRVVMELLEELVRERGRTLLLVTHNPELATRADRVLHLEGGQLVEEPRAGDGGRG